MLFIDCATPPAAPVKRRFSASPLSWLPMSSPQAIVNIRVSTRTARAPCLSVRNTLTATLALPNMSRTGRTNPPDPMIVSHLAFHVFTQCTRRLPANPSLSNIIITKLSNNGIGKLRAHGVRLRVISLLPLIDVRRLA